MSIRRLALVFLVVTPCLSHAVPVNPNAPDGVAAIFTTGGPYGGDEPILVLCTSGEVFNLHSQNYWQAVYGAGSPIPVAVSQVADWGPRHVTTFSGEHWVFTYNREWQLVGGAVVPAPCGPVANESKTLGGVKSLYR